MTDPITDAVAPRRKPLRLMAFFAGCAVAVAVIAGFVAWKQYGTLEGLFAGITMPAELSDSFFLYQHAGVNTVYYFDNGTYKPVSLGTTLQTTSLSRRGSHIASIERGADGYGVRVDASLVYLSKGTKFSAAASPSGARAAFTEASQEGLQAAFDADSARFPTQVFLVEGSAAPQFIASGFSPFFIADDELAWFTQEGLWKRDLTTGETTLVSDAVRPLPPPYPAPAVSRDGSLIAWTVPDTQTVHVGILTAEGLQIVSSYAPARGPHLTLSAQALYVAVPSAAGTAIYRHALAGDAEGKRVYGFPGKGTLIQFAP